jgi:predicted RNA-binding protein with TRAM domain
MAELPDSLRSLFVGTVRERDDSYVIEIPAHELETGGVDVGDQYRIALHEAPDWAEDADESAAKTREPHREERLQQDPVVSNRADTDGQSNEGPPVEEGEVREVTIESLGDQGDGIAKVERGYVVIVPGTRPGEQPRVEIESVKPNVAFASITDPDR